MNALARRLWVLLPVLLLTLVAGLQIDRVVRHGQSPWQGGGFGMFSTTDRVSLRDVRAIAVVDGEETPVHLSSGMRWLSRAIASVPSRDNLDAFATRLLRIPALAAAESVRVEVWRTEFDGKTRTVSLVKFRESTVARPG